MQDSLELDTVDDAGTNEDLEENTPDQTDSEWTEYCLSLLHEDELFHGIPKNDGLRRLVETLISPISSVEVDITPVVGQNVLIVAKVRIELVDGTTHEAAADANRWSTTEAFSNKLTALADTRAKSKAYREILKLRNVSSSDELTLSDDPDVDQAIESGQKLMIEKLMPKKIGVSFDTVKLIKHVLKEEKRLSSLKNSEAIKIIEQLTKFQDGEEIPEELING